MCAIFIVNGLLAALSDSNRVIGDEYMHLPEGTDQFVRMRRAYLQYGSTRCVRLTRQL